MENKNKYDPKTIRGISIYHDDKRTLYAPFYSKKAYIMTQGNIRHYVSYMAGYIAAMVIFEIVCILTKSIPLSLGAAVLVLIANFLFFYFNFLKKAAVIEDYTRQKKEGFIARQAKELEYDRIYTLIICCILLVVIFYFYALWQKLDGIYLYIIIFCGAASALYLVVNILILITKRKMDKEK
jgi:hypothetical protein